MVNRAQSRELLGSVISVGGVLGIVRAVAEPRGWLWSAIEVSVATLFVIALIAWLEAIRKERSTGVR